LQVVSAPAECFLAHKVHSFAEAAWLDDRRHTVDFQLSLESEGVGSAYPDQPLATAPDATLGEVLQLLRAQRTGALLICHDTTLVGIITERDALRFMAEGTPLSTPARDLMTAKPATIQSNATVAAAIEKMAAGGYRHLPIVDPSGQPTGVLAVRGIVHYLVDHFPETVYNLPPNPNAAPSEREGA
jgi:CBS domain-containing protein